MQGPPLKFVLYLQLRILFCPTEAVFAHGNRSAASRAKQDWGLLAKRDPAQIPIRQDRKPTYMEPLPSPPYAK
ncbi:hypothetical protein M0657_004261 [Pyricularia oryzae]|nr:hypothetical protein M9X92_009682 [Pyricularia oryzae]KAI7925285.1 hypothetical protein M0657_004261 [Pyricularia oryzae]